MTIATSDLGVRSRARVGVADREQSGEFPAPCPAGFRLLSFLIAITVGILLAVPGFSQSIRLRRAAQPPQIDGRLDDVAWRDAARIEDFFQREPDTGAPGSEKTEVLVTYDSKNIYFGFHCYHTDPRQITSKEMGRDADLGQDDRVQVMLDTFLDRRNAYWFQIGPRGSIGDGLVSDNGLRFNKQWDGLWDGKARIHGQGWDAEIVIPIATLSFRPGQTTWGLKLIRYIKVREEIMYWPVANRDTYRFQVSDSGLIEGLEGLSQGIGLDVHPYGLVGYDHVSSGDDGWVGEVGGDVFYQATPGLKLALTLNTDFADTEVDTRLVNLTRFPLFLPEKRDFFLDGSNYFTFGTARTDLTPFFSRRLGLDPDGNPIPVLWGTKLTGQQGPWNLGFLGLMDDDERGRNFFSVARVSRNIGGQSTVGGILTQGNGVSDESNYLVGGDLRLATSTFQGNKNLSLLLYGLKSKTDDRVGRDTAFGAEVEFPNDLVNFRAGLMQIEPNFLPGIGFVKRTDIREAFGDLTIGPRPGRWGLRQVFFGGSIEYVADTGGTLQNRDLGFSPLWLRFDSGDETQLTVSSQYELLEESFEVHPDYTILPGEYCSNRVKASFQSAKRRNFWFGANSSWGGFYDGDRRTTAVSTGYKVSVPLFLGLEYERNRVELQQGQFTVNVSRLNANVLFSPEVTLYSFLQYDNLSRKLGWQSRFYWILDPGNEIILVWNSTIRDPLERPELSEGYARFKVNYNFRF